MGQRGHGLLVRVGIQSDLVPEFRADQFPYWNVLHLPGNVPAGHLNAAHGSSVLLLPQPVGLRVVVVPDRTQHLVHVSWIHPHNQRLEGGQLGRRVGVNVTAFAIS